MVKKSKKPKKRIIKKKNLLNIFDPLKKRVNLFLKRRPHRSFRRTRRRDYARSLNMPGYFSFNTFVMKTLWKNRKIFILLVIVYSLLTAIIIGIASQDNYKILSETLNETSKNIFKGSFGEIGKAGLLFLSAMTGGLSQTLSDIQQVYAVIIGLLTWLTSVWLLRNILAGNKVKLRDGLYNAGSPILSMFLVVIVFIAQLIPIALAVIIAMATGLLSGAEAMLAWMVVGLLSLLSIYFVSSTFFALIIVTLPGMYPLRAIKIAGDLAIGRRLRILLRILWMLLTTAVIWTLIMIPVIIIDSWVINVWSAFGIIPIIPVIMLLLSALTIIWISAYIYLFYRKVVDDDSAPAK